MDRRQYRFLAGLLTWVAVAALGLPVSAAPGDASASPSSPAPTAATPPASPPKQATPAKNVAPPSPSPGRATPAPVSSPLLRLSPLPDKNNPRPWEWSRWGQEDPTQPQEPERILSPLALPGPKPKETDSEDSEAVRRIIEHLPVDERVVFLRNFKRWAQMTTEERQTLRRQADERRQRMQQEMDGALHDSGLHLDEDRREMFMLRYGQERRKLERELQEKLAAERARRSPEIIQRLKREFEPVSSPVPSPTATPSGPAIAGTPTGQTPTPRL